ncbi:MAG: hypothetical protein JST51_09330 [Armatimonadetes bacterium]|nr:hypothetical protein [Armatimonadota bacterium]
MEPDDPDLEYLRKLDRFFSGEEETTLGRELSLRGLAPKPSSEVADGDLHRALTDLIWSLEELRVFVEDVDHLTDRELYDALLEYCGEPTVCFAGDVNAGTHWSAIGAFSEDDIQIWLRYYADDEARARHLADFPDDPMPPSELPPYPRPWIPVRTYPAPEADEDHDA